MLIAQNKDISESAKSGTIPSRTVSKLVSKRAALIGASLFTAVCVWLYPIHRAWMFSSQGFLALQQDDIALFVARLEKAHQLTPWEPYYPYQLGWNLGELAFQSKDAQQQEALRKESIMWFEKAITLSPYREFGYSNLGWLQVNVAPAAASQNFLRATQLVPEKRGVFFALGYSLLKEGKTEKSLESMVKALWQDPILLTSQIWNEPELVEIYPQLITKFEEELSHQLLEVDTEKEKSYLYQILGSLNWWQGNFEAARVAFERVPTPLNEALLALAELQPNEQVELKVEKEGALRRLIQSWQNSEDRTQVLEKIVISAQGQSLAPTSEETINELVSELEKSLESSLSFHDWIVNNLPARARRNRRLGFGTISRHIDGAIPADFSSQSQKIAISSLFPSR